MASKWKISEDTLAAVRSALESLSFEIQDLRTEFEERSDRWQESDRGQAVAQWLDELDDHFDSIETDFDSLTEAEPDE